MVIAGFILAHWFIAAFCQTFFLHRYASHRMFSMSVFWERFFYAATLLSQGIICLPPRAYAVMHRMHHAYTDTGRDPHSPHIQKNPLRMAIHTAIVFVGLAADPSKSEPRFDEAYPTWPALDRLIARKSLRILWAAALIFLYAWFYHHFATAGWMFCFLPVHFFMGPLHGAIVNWMGHKHGYRNFDTENESRNVFPIDLLMLGEGLHNNHHSHPHRINFAVKKSELDPAYVLLKLMRSAGILRFNEKSKMR